MQQDNPGILTSYQVSGYRKFNRKHNHNRYRSFYHRNNKGYNNRANNIYNNRANNTLDHNNGDRDKNSRYNNRKNIRNLFNN